MPDENAKNTPFLQQTLESGRTIEEELRRFRSVAKLLDTQFNLFGFKFGLDGIIGLIPIVGGLVTAGAGVFSLYKAQTLGLPNSAKAKIVFNLIFDTLIGEVPILGDLIDFFFPAHAKNFRIVEKHLAERMAKQRAAAEAAKPSDPA